MEMWEYNFFLWTINHTACILQMMPEIRVALFGANPNRKFMDWAPRLHHRRPLLFILTVFYFILLFLGFFFIIFWGNNKSFLCLWKRFQKRSCRRVVCLCILSLCAVGTGQTLHMDAADARHGTAQLCWLVYSPRPPPLFFPHPQSRFTRISRTRPDWLDV